MSNQCSVCVVSEQYLCYYKSLAFLHMQVVCFFSTECTCKVSTSDAFITADKLVSIVSYGNVTDFIAEYTCLCEYRLQK